MLLIKTRSIILLKPDILHNKKIIHSIWLVAIAFIFLSSCKSTRYIPEDKYLLHKVKIKTTEVEFNKEELYNYIQQKPNRKTLFVFKFHLTVYNLANRGKDRKWKKWVREVIGEEPVIFDSYLEKKSLKQLKIFLVNKGYYNSIIKDTVFFRNKKATIKYDIEAKIPYRIKNIDYEIQDSLLEDLIIDDIPNSLIKKNIPLNIDVLQKERNRITKYLQDNGYFKFTKEFIFFEIDTLVWDNYADITVGIKKFIRRIDKDNYVNESHKKYKIKEIIIHTNYDPKYSFDPKQLQKVDFDTLFYKNIQFIYQENLAVKPAVLMQSIYFKLGDIYSKQNVDLSYEYLSALRLYRLVNINFKEQEKSKYQKSENGILEAHIYLTPLKQQSFAIEVEGTNSSSTLSGDNIGFASNLIYRHKNLFHGAELFDVSLTGAFGILPIEESDRYTFEYGVKTNLYIPKFLLPGRAERFIKKYNPKTIIPVSFNVQKRPDFSRNIANLGYGYYWNSAKTINHIVQPLNLNFVEYTDTSNIDSTRFIYYNGFQNQFIPYGSYTLLINNKLNGEKKNYSHIMANVEIAGNFFSGFGKLFNWDISDDDDYLLFGNVFAQYLKFSIDYRYNINFEHQNLVFRVFTDAGFPYGNSKALPFIKQFYSGGAYSIRAWQARALGPGTINYKDDSDAIYPNQLGDIKLEANIEYRFNMFWILEGAVFLDAGNIWYQNNSDLPEEGIFRMTTFYKQIALGTGFGARLDFSFFVFRLDLGIPAFDPSLPSGEQWIFRSNEFNLIDDVVFNLGIGYPF